MLQSLSPAVVKTEFLIASGTPAINPEEIYKGPSLESKDVADAVVYILGTPPHVQVLVTLRQPSGLHSLPTYFQILTLLHGTM
jgi:NADP-dependent 3-hydroxy acid dehydrogenase YdfG